MIYIFLDLDGVLMTDEEYWINTKEYWIENPWAKDVGSIRPFNSKCVENFNKILNVSSNIKIILSSDWKRHKTLDDLDVIFKNNGVIKSPEDTTKTENSYFGEWLEKLRMSEIESYLRTNNLVNKKWIIIDDLNVSQWLPDEFKNRFFLTQDDVGLKDLNIVNRIIEFIKDYETEKNNSVQ